MCLYLKRNSRFIDCLNSEDWSCGAWAAEMLAVGAACTSLTYLDVLVGRAPSDATGGWLAAPQWRALQTLMMGPCCHLEPAFWKALPHLTALRRLALFDMTGKQAAPRRHTRPHNTS